MKKALLVTRVSGFVPQHEMNNVKILQEMGYEVHYAADFHTVVYGKDNRRLEGTDIILHQIDFCRSPFSRKVKVAERQLEKLMFEGEFDLIHCHMPMSAVVTRRAAWRVRKKTGREVPVLYTAHGFHFCRGVSWKNWLYYPIERYYARYTDRLLLINEEDYRRGCRFPIRGKAVKINGAGIDLERMKPYRKSSWNVGGHVVLVTVGELAPAKNHLAAIEAMAELRDLKLVYLICGTGRMEEALRQRVQELHLEEQVRFMGYVENVPELLQQCDCFLFPSGREGLPVSVIEAMAVGLPVSASEIRGVHDLIEDTQGGYLCRGFSPHEYAGKVRLLFQDFQKKPGESSMPSQARREQMGRWNQERVQCFSLDVVDKQMRYIYSEVVR